MGIYTSDQHLRNPPLRSYNPYVVKNATHILCAQKAFDSHSRLDVSFVG
jgi:hypothetical protein